jgi:hypothetical protein
VWKVFGRAPILGFFHGDRFWLRRRARLNNAYHTVASGRVLSSLSGSRIEVRFGGGLTTLVFMAVWFGGLAVITAKEVSVASRSQGIGRLVREAPEIFLLPIGMSIFAMGLLAFGRWLARNDEAYLTDRIRVTTRSTGSQEIPLQG